MPRLEVRPLRPDEAGLVAGYFLDASDADHERMGLVERARLPARADWERTLRQTLERGPASGSFYLAWLVDGEAIGHSSLKNLKPGDSADIHLHMWSAAHRGQGFGTTLFCKSVVEAYDRFRLRSLVCEPRAANPMPNRVLQKAGFPLVRTYEGSSSELSRFTTLNRYDVRREVAAAWLAKA